MTKLTKTQRQHAAGILLKAATLIDDPDRWTQGESARDVAGRPVSPLDPSAVCWCAEGAVVRESGMTTYAQSTEYQGLFYYIGDTGSRRRTYGPLVAINDVDGREAAVAAMRRVAAELVT